ncbi:MAG: bestrophin family ion channel [Planctomycetota bacterium]
MLIKPRYSPGDVLRWTRIEIVLFFSYALVVTALYELVGLEFLHLPWAPVAVVGTAVAFIVGFQNNAAYGRIWEARKIWGGIVNASRSFAMRVQDCVTAERAREPVTEEELAEHRRVLLYRHISWLTALRHTMRQPRPWETSDDHPTNREWSEFTNTPERALSLEEELAPTLPEEDRAKVMASTNRPAALLFAQSRHLRMLEERGLVWEFAFLELQQNLQTLFELQGKSERIKNFPYPRQYATLSYEFVRLFLVFLPFAAIPEFARIGAELTANGSSAGSWFPWLAAPFSLVMSWIFYVMERIGRVGENPFEGSPNDVPISTIARGIEIDLREMMGEDEERVPAPLEANCQVQM